LVLFNGGFNTSENSVFYVHEDKSITINTDYLDPLNPSALKIVNANAESTSMIRTESTINDFAEINSVNKNSGDTASSDVVATNDLGDTDETQGYVNMGINSTTFNQVGEVGAAGDGYMFSTGNDLYIGNATPGKKLVLFNGGSDTTAYAKFFIHEDASITINTALVDTDNPAAIRIVNANGTTRMIHSDGYIDDYSEIENVNASPGNSASADIVAANNLGDTDSTQGYVDMGINSTTYNVPNNIGGPNDAYVYGTGNRIFVLYVSQSPYEVCESTESSNVDVQKFMSVVVVCRKDDEPDAARVHEFRVSLHTVLMNVGGRSNLVTIFDYPRVAISLPRCLCVRPPACPKGMVSVGNQATTGPYIS
jgi:hypothetical protein